MVDVDGVRDDAKSPETQAREAMWADEIKQKTLELVEFRDAGVLSEAEFEEQKIKLRWSVGR
jgi:hypothetical protein